MAQVHPSTDQGLPAEQAAKGTTSRNLNSTGNYTIPSGARASPARPDVVEQVCEVGSEISHYRIDERIGSGAVGIVYRAQDLRLDRPVALKFLSPALCADRESRERFTQEAVAASSLDHPNICTVFEIDECDAGLFIAMAYYPGETLASIIARGALPLPRALRIAGQIGKGLAAAHEELIVHRDVKPGNVMITRRDTVKILDFGLAKLLQQRGGADAGMAFGTPLYMSPEQLYGQDVDPRADIWALGVVLYEMVAGHSPFDRHAVYPTIRAILNDEPGMPAGLPARLDTILRRALQKSPRARYDSMDDFVRAIRALESDFDEERSTARRPAELRRNSVAVLPFVDLSSARDQEYFCDGIAEEILCALGRIPELRVASRTSSFQFRGGAMDVRDIGRRLNVSSVLEGSVRRSGDRVRVSAQLVNVEDGYRLWSDRFDRDTKDILAIQDEIARRIAEALEVTLAVERISTVPGSQENPRAWELYLKGRKFFHQHRRKTLELARQMFENAIEVDPAYARAWAGIAECSAFLRLYFGAGQDAVDDAERASLRAVELGPDLAETHTARGLALSLSGNWKEAEAELGRAIELNPSLYDAHYMFGRVAFACGNMAEAAKHFERACTISPASFDVWYLLGMCYRNLHEPEKARNADFECLEATKRHLASLPEDTRAWTMGAATLVEFGEPEKGAAWIARALAIDPEEPLIAYNAACTYTTLGRYDDALRCLERVSDVINPGWLENDPDLDPLRGDPRFARVLEKSPRR